MTPSSALAALPELFTGVVCGSFPEDIDQPEDTSLAFLSPQDVADLAHSPDRGGIPGQMDAEERALIFGRRAWLWTDSLSPQEILQAEADLHRLGAREVVHLDIGATPELFFADYNWDINIAVGELSVLAGRAVGITRPPEPEDDDLRLVATRQGEDGHPEIYFCDSADLDAARACLPEKEDARLPEEDKVADRDPSDPATPPPPLTDAGNAERLAALNAKYVHYIPEMNRWMIWREGEGWRFDADGELIRRTIEMTRSIFAEAAQEPDRDRSQRLAKWGAASQNASRIHAAIELLKAQPGITIAADRLDADPLILGVPGGRVVDLKTGLARPARREDLVTKRAGAAFDHLATCPAFRRFLERIQPDREIRAYLSRKCGYDLTGLIREHVFSIAWGSGANGKSTLARALAKAWGDYATQASPEMFLLQRGASIPSDVAALRGVRLCLSLESDSGSFLNEPRVKALTGGDLVSARFLYGEWFQFRPTAKFIFGTNHRPVVSGTDLAIWRRIHLIPFSVTIPPEEQDPSLAEKLEAEAAGILAWAVRGCVDYLAVGLNPPAPVLAAVEEYRETSDLIRAFVEERCVLDPQESTRASEVYRGYAEWAKANGYRAISNVRLGRELVRFGVERRPGHGNVKLDFGIRLRLPDGGDGYLGYQVTSHPETF